MAIAELVMLTDDGRLEADHPMWAAGMGYGASEDLIQYEPKGSPETMTVEVAIRGEVQKMSLPVYEFNGEVGYVLLSDMEKSNAG